MTMSEHATHQFAPEAASAAAARQFVRQTLTDWGAHAVLDDAVLLTNELVTNAVMHAGTDLNVSCALGAGYVQIGVADSHASRALPTAVSNSAPEKTSGRGLYLLSQIAQSWGVEYDRTSTRVWFRLSLSAAPAPTAGIAHQPRHFIDLGGSRTPVRVAVVETDPGGVVRHWSAEAHRLLGWSADDVLAKPLADVVVDAVPAAGSTESFAELLARPRWYGECRMRTSRGDEIEVFASQVHATAGEQPRASASGSRPRAAWLRPSSSRGAPGALGS